MTTVNERMVFLDGSRLIIEAMARAGVGAYIGYPITPVNWLFAGAKQRIPIALEAPDEITALQWAAGFSSSGVFPVTASAFPGFALMIESINMSFMMELPMVIILAQRLGPSTGSERFSRATLAIAVRLPPESRKVCTPVAVYSPTPSQT